MIINGDGNQIFVTKFFVDEIKWVSNWVMAMGAKVMVKAIMIKQVTQIGPLMLNSIGDPP